jgi:predicted amidohydrolase
MRASSARARRSAGLSIPPIGAHQRVLPLLRLAVHQFAPRLGDRAANAERIAAAARQAAGDLFVTPELALTGYDVGDDAARLAVAIEPGKPLSSAVPSSRAPGVECVLVLGAIERGARGVPYNAAIVVRHDLVETSYRKIYLPTYGMFDEGRFFGRGRRLCTFEPLPGWRAGLLICEDFWHPGLIYVLAMAGIDVLLVPAAAPGRGVWEGGENGGRFRSADVWERIARTTAQLYGIYVALANRTGVEGGVTFAGGSLIVGPDGAVLARADEASEVVLTAELTRTELERVRRPYAHERDDDARLVARELERLVLDA